VPDDLNIGPEAGSLMAHSTGASGLVPGSRSEAPDVHPINSRSCQKTTALACLRSGRAYERAPGVRVVNDAIQQTGQSRPQLSRSCSIPGCPPNRLKGHPRAHRRTDHSTSTVPERGPRRRQRPCSGSPCPHSARRRAVLSRYSDSINPTDSPDQRVHLFELLLRHGVAVLAIRVVVDEVVARFVAGRAFLGGNGALLVGNLRPDRSGLLVDPSAHFGIGALERRTVHRVGIAVVVNDPVTAFTGLNIAPLDVSEAFGVEIELHRHDRRRGLLPVFPSLSQDFETLVVGSRFFRARPI
jgi:hypothetical protein